MKIMHKKKEQVLSWKYQLCVQININIRIQYFNLILSTINLDIIIDLAPYYLLSTFIRQILIKSKK